MAICIITEENCGKMCKQGALTRALMRKPCVSPGKEGGQAATQREAEELKP